MDGAPWFDPDAPEEPPASRPWRPRALLLVLSGLPWLLVAALLLLPGRTAERTSHLAPGTEPAAEGAHGPGFEALDRAAEPGHPGTSGFGAAAGPADAAHGSLPEPVTTPGEDADPTDLLALLSDVDDLEVREIRGRWRVEAGPEEAVALAVVAGRAWLTGTPPVLEITGLSPTGRDGYAEHLVVEAVEQPDRDALVVTLVGIVLDREARGLVPSVRRIAVPMLVTPSGARVAGAPWELPPPSLEPAALPREALDDGEEITQARAALDAAGFARRELTALYATAAWPVIAEVRRPDGTTEEVWLRRHLGGYVVGGTTLAASRAGRDGQAAGSGQLEIDGEDGR